MNNGGAIRTLTPLDQRQRVKMHANQLNRSCIPITIGDLDREIEVDRIALDALVNTRRCDVKVIT
jgi:hypothetical protein